MKRNALYINKSKMIRFNDKINNLSKFKNYRV